MLSPASRGLPHTAARMVLWRWKWITPLLCSECPMAPEKTRKQHRPHMVRPPLPHPHFLLLSSLFTLRPPHWLPCITCNARKRSWLQPCPGLGTVLPQRLTWLTLTPPFRSFAQISALTQACPGFPSHCCHLSPALPDPLTHPVLPLLTEQIVYLLCWLFIISFPQLEVWVHKEIWVVFLIHRCVPST